MRKFLLSTIALMMSLAMLAVGTGDGSSKANAIDFDWADGHKPALSAGSWYRVDLSPLKAEANDPTLALYLTNLSDVPASVTVKVEASVTIMGQTQSGTSSYHYTIAGQDYQLWSIQSFSAAGTEMSLKQMIGLGLSEVYLQLTSNQEIALSAKVYETEDIVDDACAQAKDFEWSGVSVAAGEQWFRLNLRDVKTSDKQLNFVVTNDGSSDAHVSFDMSLDCPASAVIEKDWVIAAGADQEDAFGRIFLDVLTEDYVFVRLTTDQPLTLRVEEEVVVVDPDEYADFACASAPLLPFGEDLSLTAGKHVYKVLREDLMGGRDFASEFYVTNATSVAANLTVEVAFSCPVTSTVDQHLVIAANSTVMQPIKDNVLKAFDSEWVYIRFITDQPLTASIGKRNTDPCSTAIPFDWTTGASLSAGETQWYDVDITSLKQNKQHVHLSFTNHSDQQTWVTIELAMDCAGERQLMVVPVPANLTVSQTIDYRILNLSPVNRCLLGLTTDGPIEMAASVKNYIADDPTPCLNAVDVEPGVEYVHAAGTSQWYRVSLSPLENVSSHPSFYMANKSGQRANLRIGMVHDCQYTSGTTLPMVIPSGFVFALRMPDWILDVAKRTGAFDKVKDIDVFLEVSSDQDIHFGLDVDNELTNPCERTDLIPFDWTTGAKVNAGETKWFDLDIAPIKASEEHVKLTFTNHSESITWVAAMVALDCPARITLPMIVPVPGGMSVDQVIDYSFFASSAIEHLYIGVHPDATIELAASTQTAIVGSTDGCDAATLMESGKTYTHAPGTAWYNFPMSLLDELGEAAGLQFKNNGSRPATLTAGVTVGCQYGIITRRSVTVPQGVDISLNVPKRIINKLREFIDTDITNFYLQLTSDQPLALGVNMAVVDMNACVSAVDFDWASWEANGLKLEANQDIWYKVNLDHPLEKLEQGEDIVVSLSNASDVDIDVEVAVTPTCPSYINLEKTLTIPAKTTAQKVLSYTEVMSLLERYGKYVFNSDSELVLVEKYDLLVLFNKLNALAGKYGKHIPLSRIESLIDRYGRDVTVGDLLHLLDNYEQYLSTEELAQRLMALKDKIDPTQLISLLETYGPYIPSARAQELLDQYLPVAGIGAAMIIDKCEPYITVENLQKVIDRIKQHIPFDALKQLVDKIKQYLPEDNTCYVRVKTAGEIIVEPDTIPDTPTGCEAAKLLDWTQEHNLSDLPTGWYKFDLTSMHANRQDFSVTLNNDLGADTVITAHAYLSCDDVKPLASVTRGVSVGKNTESIAYSMVTSLLGTAPELYVYLETGVLPDLEDCSSAIPFEWNTTITIDKEVWYVVNAQSIIDNKQSVEVTVTNPASSTITADFWMAISCPVIEDELYGITGKEIASGSQTKTLTYQQIEEELGYYGADPSELYLHIVPSAPFDVTTKIIGDTIDPQPEKQYEYKTITDYVCDGTAYTDYITGKDHIISSIITSTQTWNDTVTVSEELDSIYTFVVRPIIAPVMMTTDLLSTIAGATPVLSAGEAVNVSGTIDAIKGFYDAHDTELIADVNNVVWTAGADATLECDATEHTMILLVEAGCDFAFSTTLTFAVTPVEVQDTIYEVTICEGESYTWPVDGNIYEDVPGTHTFYAQRHNDKGCLIEDATLILTVEKASENVLAAEEVAICETELPYTWTVNGHDITCESADTYYDTVTVDCSKTISVLKLTVNPVTENVLAAETAQVCFGASYTWRGESYSESAAGVYTYNDTVLNACVKDIYTLHLTVLPEVIDTHVYDTICSDEVNHVWNGISCPVAGDYPVTLTDRHGCDSVVVLHLHIADADNNPAYDNLKAVGKYGDRLLLLHVNNLRELVESDILPDTPSESNVTWYRVVGERDKISEILTGTASEPDEELPGASYYHNNADGSPLDAGLYYAVMTLVPEQTGFACTAYLRTETIELGQSASLLPRLMPTIAQPSSDLHVLNLNPSSVSEIRVYTTTGELQATYTSADATEFIIQAATMPGYYMVEVQSAGEKVTLRYIVK